MDAIPEEWLHTLRAAPLFRELGTSELMRIAELVEEQHHPQGTLLGQQGEPGTHLYVLVEGLIHIPSPVGTTATLLMSPPEVFGVAALVSPHRHLATATTGSPCRTLAIPVGGLRGIMDTDASIGRRLFHEVARYLYQRFEESINDAHGRPSGNYLQ